jgi:hypothetical protein
MRRAHIHRSWPTGSSRLGQLRLCPIHGRSQVHVSCNARPSAPPKAPQQSDDNESGPILKGQGQSSPPEREPNTGLHKLLKLLAKSPMTSWLAGAAEHLLRWPLVRTIMTLSLFCILILFREASIQNARFKPREVCGRTHKACSMSLP